MPAEDEADDECCCDVPTQLNNQVVHCFSYLQLIQLLGVSDTGSDVTVRCGRPQLRRTLNSILRLRARLRGEVFGTSGLVSP